METERKIIGDQEPVVLHVVELSRWARVRELEIEDGDHLRIDEQGLDNIHEPEESDTQ